jgi:hypothetical protein
VKQKDRDVSSGITVLQGGEDVKFKADHAVEPFIFGWLKRPYAEALDDAGTNTENRIRILKLILLVNPNAVLNIKITPLD